MKHACRYSAIFLSSFERADFAMLKDLAGLRCGHCKIIIFTSSADDFSQGGIAEPFQFFSLLRLDKSKTTNSNECALPDIKMKIK